MKKERKRISFRAAEIPETSNVKQNGPSKNTAPRALVIHNQCLIPGDLKHSFPIKSVDIQYCYVDYHNKRYHEKQLLSELLTLLHQNTDTLTSINLRGLFPRHCADVTVILKVLQQCKLLESVILLVPEEERVHFSPEWIAVFKQNPCLSKVCLESFDLTATSSVDHMVQSLRDAVGLRDLSLAGCRIHDKGLWNLVHELEYLKRLKAFRIPRCTLLSHVSLMIASSLLQLNMELQVLDLTGNKRMFLQEEEEEEAFLSESSHGGELFATNNNDKDEKSAYIRRESSVSLFIKSLTNNSTLAELYLAHCGIKDEDFKFLLRALERNIKLSVLSVDYNQITRRHGLEKHFVQALKNLKLKQVSIRGVLNILGQPCRKPWAEKSLKALLTALEGEGSSRSLVYLRLDDVRRHADIDDVLERNQKFQKYKKIQALQPSGVNAQEEADQRDEVPYYQ